MFIQGHKYIRTEIHDLYGGQTQGGISTPQDSSMILLFTGEQGEQYGYNDSWENGIFLFTGEGQVGDMELVRGNRAIIDHSKDGKDLHLFSTSRKEREVTYIGQMVCSGYREGTGSDRNQNNRKIIIFELVPISSFIIPSQEEELQDDKLWDDDFTKSRKKAFAAAQVSPRSKEAKQTIIERSEIIRIYI